ncbi:ATP-binding protein [Deinococcus apachensis]|uniref:ATP-binding protein n=1 Tax=Deinococcus apachensis TaxID=309886 RepID=UPI000368F3AF|nr:AAA family ATPase [Deinococcus apachensis]
MSQLQLFLLGVPELHLDGQPVHLRTRKMLALLAYLAVDGEAHPRDELADLLWPGPPEKARAALRLALHHIQVALDRDAGLSVTRDSLELRRGGLWVDALDLAARAIDYTRTPDPADLQLWRGDFLQGFAVGGSPLWDDWVSARTLEYAEHYGRLLDRLTQAQLSAGHPWDAISTARRWVDHDPLSEDAYRQLARAQRAAGRNADALETERTCRETLRRELGTAPPQARPHPAAEPDPPQSPPPAMPELPSFLVGDTLIGRQEEFARLVEAYRRAARGAPQAVLLSGEPGIGKTRLAGELLAWARGRQAPLLRGRALETARLPFAVLTEALGRETTWLNERLEARYREDLARLLPDLLNGPVPPALGNMRSRLLEALSAAVLSLLPSPDAREPLVLLLDDLHWADTGTLEALLHLAARLSEFPAPLLMILTARAEYLGTDKPLSSWLARLRRHLPLLALPLGPLTAANTRHLLTGVLPQAPTGLIGRLAGWLFGETGGQPLYLTETLKSLMESGALTTGAHGPQLDEARLPRGVEGVRAAIGERLARLSPAALGLAQGAAVLGRDTPFDVLCAVADLEDEEALMGYEELLRSGLLVELGSEDESLAMLSHDQVRETLRDGLSRPRRQVLHRRAFLALQGRGTPSGTLAQHAVLGGLTSEGATLFEQAALAAKEVGAYDEALTALERALSLVPLHPEQEEHRLRLLLSVAVILFIRDAALSPGLLGRLRQAVEAAGNAGIPGEQAAALHLLAADLLRAGRLDEAESSFQTELIVSRTASASRAEVQALIGLTRVATARWDWATAQAYGEQALRLAGSLGQEHEDLTLTTTLVLAILRRWASGALREAREQIATLLPRAREFERRGLARPSYQGSIFNRVLWELIWQDQHVGAYDEALDHLRELEGLGGRAKEELLATRALIHLRQGDIQNALVASHAAIELSERLHLKFPYVHGIRAVCLLQNDQHDKAQLALAVGQAINATYNHVRDRADSALRFGEVLLALGDPDGAEREYRWVLSTFSLPHVLGALQGMGQVRARRGDGAGAALCFGAVLAHGAAGLYLEERARATLAELCAHFLSNVIDHASNEGALTPLKQVVQRVQAEPVSET